MKFQCVAEVLQVMAGLVPAIHAFLLQPNKAWMAVTGTAMTMLIRLVASGPTLIGWREIKETGGFR
jgi:hypothetical protein